MKLLATALIAAFLSACAVYDPAPVPPGHGGCPPGQAKKGRC